MDTVVFAMQSNFNTLKEAFKKSFITGEAQNISVEESVNRFAIRQAGAVHFSRVTRKVRRHP